MNKDFFLEELKSQREVFDARVAEAEKCLAEIQADKQAWERTVKLYESDSLQMQIQQEAKTIRNRSYDLLYHLEKPLHYTAIYKILIAMGFEVKGQDPEHNLLAHLAQDIRFLGLGDGIWGLASWNSVPPEGIPTTNVSPTNGTNAPEPLKTATPT
jgi:hypothetical protein